MYKQTVFVLLFLVSIASAYGIERQNGGITYSNVWGKLSEYPEVLYGSGDVYLNLTSNFSTVQHINIAFSFDTSRARPIDAFIIGNAPHEVPIFGNTLRSVFCGNGTYGIINATHVYCSNATESVSLYCPSPRTFNTNPTNATCYYNQSNTVIGWNTQYWNDWVNINDHASVITQGSVKHYYFTDVVFNPGETKVAKLSLFASRGVTAKYNITMWRTQDTLQEAFSNGYYVHIDPVINNSQQFCEQLLYSCPGNGCQNNSIMTILITNTTMINYMGDGGKSLRFYYNVSAVDYPTNYTMMNWSAGLNASIYMRFINGTNGSTSTQIQYWMCYNDTAGGATSMSNGQNTFDIFTNMTYQDTSNWTAYGAAPYMNGYWGEYQQASAIGIYRNYNVTVPVTMFFEAGSDEDSKVILTCGRWEAGNGFWGFWWQDQGVGGYAADSISTRNGAGSGLNVKTVITDKDKTYVFRFIWNQTGMNMSRQNTSNVFTYGKGRLESNRWVSIWQMNETPATLELMPIYMGGAVGQNMSLMWVGIINASQHPEFTGFGDHIAGGGANAVPYANTVTWCNGTACNALGTVYKGTVTSLNTSGWCNDTDGGFETGYWNFTINQTMKPVYFNIRYLWTANQINYSNGTFPIVDGVLNKSDTWQAWLTCWDGTDNSTINSSAAFTVNNTACVLGAPTISPVTGNLANNSTILTCTNGSYTDADSDAQSTWGTYAWYMNNTLLAGQTAQTLNLTNITGGVSGSSWFNCSWRTGDTGYSNVTCNSTNSTNVTINSPPVVSIQSPPAGYAFNGTNIITMSFIAVDNNASTMNCTLYSNASGSNAVMNVSNTVANNTLTWMNFSVSASYDSPFWINVSCWDGNVRESSGARTLARWECWNISFNTQLTEDVSHNANCFRILRDNVTLDCNGYSVVNQDLSGDSGSGVYFQELNGVTIENCWFSRFSAGIYPVQVNHTVIRNNTVFGNSTANDVQGVLWTTTGVIPHMVNNSIYNNTFEINSTNGYAMGIYAVIGGFDLNDTRIENNTIFANSTNDIVIGIDFNQFGNAYRTNLSNNSIALVGNGLEIYGIYIINTQTTNETTIKNNIITTRSLPIASDSFGIYLNDGGVSFNGTNIISNIFECNSSAANSNVIWFETTGVISRDNLIQNNSITLNSTAWIFGNRGISLYNISYSLISDNNISMVSPNGNSELLVLDGEEADYNNVTGNQFIIGNWSIDIIDLNIDNTLIYYNNFTAKSVFGGYVFDPSGDNMYNNSIYGNWWGDILLTDICDMPPISGIGDTNTPYNSTKGNVSDNLVNDYHPFTLKVCSGGGGGGGGTGGITMPANCSDGTPIEHCSNITLGYYCYYIGTLEENPFLCPLPEPPLPEPTCADLPFPDNYKCSFDEWLVNNTQFGDLAIPNAPFGFIMGLFTIFADFSFNKYFLVFGITDDDDEKKRKVTQEIRIISLLAIFFCTYCLIWIIGGIPLA